MFYVYILKSLKDNHFYYGSTSNLDERLVYHNKGRVRATKSRIPWRMHYSEIFQTRKEAVQRELFFKSRAGYRWLKANEVI
jgi:putative endonuclease